MATINDEPGKFDLRIFQGKTYERDIYLLEEGLTDIAANRENLTDVVYQCQIMDDYADCGGNTIIDLSPYITYNSVTREAKLRIPASITLALDFESAVWELNFIYLDTTVLPILTGQAFLFLRAIKVVE